MPASILWNRPPLPPGRLAPLPLTALHPGEELLALLRRQPARTIEERLMTACLLRDRDAMTAAEAELLALMKDTDAPDTPQLRALLRYHAISADKAVPLYLLRYAKTLRDALMAGEVLPVDRAANIGDPLQMLLWLYNLTGQRALLETCRLLKAQAPDWMSTLHIFPQTKAVAQPPPHGSDAYWRVHGPTIAASLKTPALQALFEGGGKNEAAFAEGWEKLTRYHGAAHGLFSADPLLAGCDPARGVDGEVVLELMHTFQTLLWAQGKPVYGDLLEETALGPLAYAEGTQSANQLGESPAGARAALYAASQWMATADGGLALIGYAPGAVRWRLDGQLVRAAVETDYPNAETATLRMTLRDPQKFPLLLRIPAWAEDASVTVGKGKPIPCKAGTFARIERVWHDGDEVFIQLPMRPQIQRWYHQSVSVRLGPRTFVLDAAAEPPWHVALLEDEPFELDSTGGIPSLRAAVATIPAWVRADGSQAGLPVRPQVAPEDIRRVSLRPYGLTPVRTAQFPSGVRSGENEGG